MGKRNYKTAKLLRNRLVELKITYDAMYTDDWTSFNKTFKEDNHIIGKTNTVGIEGTTQNKKSIQKNLLLFKKNYIII